MRYKLTNHEWTAIKPMLPNKPRDRIFDAFYTTKPDGLGTGLSVCRTIVEAHGGKLWATAAGPHGTIFQFTLPVTGDDRALSAQHITAPHCESPENVKCVSTHYEIGP
jgi:Histidine kinase-, DNA gyrase B-, and HSP90-like ATPase